jgi:hypothetical protein
MKIVSKEVDESATHFLSSVLLDEDDKRVPGSSCTALTLTLYNKHDGTIINSRNGIDVLNNNGGTLDEQGNFNFEFTPADTAIITDALGYENRVALFVVTFGSARKIRQEIELKIRNAVKVP